MCVSVILNTSNFLAIAISQFFVSFSFFGCHCNASIQQMCSIQSIESLNQWQLNNVCVYNTLAKKNSLWFRWKNKTKIMNWHIAHHQNVDLLRWQCNMQVLSDFPNWWTRAFFQQKTRNYEFIHYMFIYTKPYKVFLFPALLKIVRDILMGDNVILNRNLAFNR